MRALARAGSIKSFCSNKSLDIVPPTCYNAVVKSEKQSVKYEITASLRELSSAKMKELDRALDGLFSQSKNSINWEVLGEFAEIEIWIDDMKDGEPLEPIYEILEPYSTKIWLDEGIYNSYTIYEG